MKRLKILAVLACILLLMGCSRAENPYRVDTVVRIPVDPTEVTAETETATEVPTEEPTEAAATEEPAQPTEAASETSGKKSSSTKKNTSTKKSSSRKTSSQSQKSEETEPATQPPTEAEETSVPREAEETAAPTEPPFDPSDYSAGNLEYAILDEMNACRAESETAELTMSSKLCGIAALRAREIARVWSHTRPDGRNYTSAMSDYGYGFSTSAENLAHASGSGKASSIVKKWMNSDNREDILSGDFTKAGVGVYRADGMVWVVALLVG